METAIMQPVKCIRARLYWKGSMGTKTLTPKQARFVREYLKGHNGKWAAIRAGYAPHTAEITASKLLRLSKVRQLVESKTEKQLEKMGEVWTPPKGKPPFQANETEWRVKRIPIRRTDPLEMHVEVFQEQDLTQPIINLVTLIEDF